MSAEAAGAGPGATGGWREKQVMLLPQFAERRADLPLRHLPQQGHITAPASNARLAERALGDAHGVAGQLLTRHGITPPDLAGRLGGSAQSFDGIFLPKVRQPVDHAGAVIGRTAHASHQSMVPALTRRGVPGAPVKDPREALASPPVGDRGVVLSARNPRYGEYRRHPLRGDEGLSVCAVLIRSHGGPRR